jgi:hypothetical protein
MAEFITSKGAGSPAPAPAADATSTGPGRTYLLRALAGRAVIWTEPGANAAFDSEVKGSKGRALLAAQVCAKDWAKIDECVRPDATAQAEDFDFLVAGLVNNIHPQIKRCKGKLATVQEFLADLVAAHGHLESCRDLALMIDELVADAATGLEWSERKLEVMILRYNQGPASRTAPSPGVLSKHFRGPLKGAIKQMRSKSERLREALQTPSHTTPQKVSMWENQLRILSEWTVEFVTLAAKHPLARLTLAQLDVEIKAAQSGGLEMQAAGASEKTKTALEAAMVALGGVLLGGGSVGDGGGGTSSGDGLAKDDGSAAFVSK